MINTYVALDEATTAAEMSKQFMLAACTLVQATLHLLWLREVTSGILAELNPVASVAKAV